MSEKWKLAGGAAVVLAGLTIVAGCIVGLAGHSETGAWLCFTGYVSIRGLKFLAD